MAADSAHVDSAAGSAIFAEDLAFPHSPVKPALAQLFSERVGLHC